MQAVLLAAVNSEPQNMANMTSVWCSSWASMQRPRAIPHAGWTRRAAAGKEENRRNPDGFQGFL